MKSAEDFVREKLSDQYEVLGGYIAPCHPSYLYEKLGGRRSSCIPNSTRNHLIELGIETDPTWMVDYYLQGTSEFVHNDKVLMNFRERVN